MTEISTVSVCCPVFPCKMSRANMHRFLAPNSSLKIPQKHGKLSGGWLGRERPFPFHLHLAVTSMMYACLYVCEWVLFAQCGQFLQVFISEEINVTYWFQVQSEKITNFNRNSGKAIQNFLEYSLSDQNSIHLENKHFRLRYIVQEVNTAFIVFSSLIHLIGPFKNSFCNKRWYSNS